MIVSSRIYDNKIKAENVFIEMTYRNFLNLVEVNLGNNDLQRRRVKSSNTVYSLLKRDIREGAIIPPIVLALTDVEPDKSSEEIIDMNNDAIIEYIQQNKKSVIILDGLQRTHTIIDLIKELTAEASEDLEKVYSYKLRVEFYLGLNKFGILYRMLTLNTGQTPMSLRHQIEILYGDLAKMNLEGITIIKEVESEMIDEIGKYKFQDLIEGFNSYLERNELPLGRKDLLNNIQGVDKLSMENRQEDIFKQYILTYHRMIIKFDKLFEEWKFDERDLEQLNGPPFGKEIYKVFNKSQAMTGFGAAIGKLKDFEIISNLHEVEKIIESVCLVGDPREGILELLIKLDDIKNTSKKIGNAQRSYFQYFFRDLFNPENDSYLKFDEAVESAYNKYKSQVE